jgi:precorrin-6A synthase
MVDVFFFMDKGEAKQDLVALRKEICERYIENRSYGVVEAEDPVATRPYRITQLELNSGISSEH